jgi:transposase
MPKPYSDDLRWRLVWLKLFYGMSNVDISSTLFVSPKTVSRIYRLFVTTGNVTSPKVFGRPKGTTTLYEHEELIMCEILLRQPTIHLKEIAYEIENTTGTIDFLLRVFAGSTPAWIYHEKGEFQLQ